MVEVRSLRCRRIAMPLAAAALPLLAVLFHAAGPDAAAADAGSASSWLLGAAGVLTLAMLGVIVRLAHRLERQHAGLQRQAADVARRERRLAQAQRAARLGSWQWEAGDAAAAASDELLRILGRATEGGDLGVRRCLRAVPPEDRRGVKEQLAALRAHGGEVEIEHRVRGPDGAERVVHHRIACDRDAAGRVVSLAGTLQDVTERRRTEEKMRRLALYDGLTGLANRQHFDEHLRNAVARSKRHGTGLATLFIDLDRFRRINDTLGRTVGDALLRHAAARLRACVRETDAVAPVEHEGENLVARLGGDEFIVLLRDILSPRDAVMVAHRMIGELAAPFVIEGHELVVTASIGIAMHPADGDTVDALVKAADAAMVAAKKLGRNTFQFFTEEMNTIAFEKLSLEGQLRRAIETGQFVLHYQPKVDVATGAIHGVEALIRWDHPEWGLVAPGRFISLAEEMGLITAIGDWVLEESCRQCAEWASAGLGRVSVAVNLASPSFRKPRLVQELAALIARHGMQPAQLQIEATESMLMESAGATLQTLRELHELGVTLSIDDFGTGYSSLSYLRRFPVDQLKIDRSFVTEMTHNFDDAAIAAAIVSLGRNMRREVVAEGVETLEQARLLRQQGCNLMQGFLFSRAVPAPEIERLLRQERPFAGVASAAACEDA